MIYNNPALFSLYFYDDIKLYPPLSFGISLIKLLTKLLFEHEKANALFGHSGSGFVFIQFLRSNKKRLPGE